LRNARLRTLESLTEPAHRLRVGVLHVRPHQWGGEALRDALEAITAEELSPALA
jgi:hypothetical protein